MPIRFLMTCPKRLRQVIRYAFRNWNFDERQTSIQECVLSTEIFFQVFMIRKSIINEMANSIRTEYCYIHIFYLSFSSPRIIETPNTVLLFFGLPLSIEFRFRIQNQLRL